MSCDNPLPQPQPNSNEAPSNDLMSSNPTTDGTRQRNVGQSEPKKEEKKPEDTTGSFECNICLDTAKNAVVSMCGHLFCWPCIHEWMNTGRSENCSSCPVCKSAISKDKVIPLYGRGADSSQDPRAKIPPRPQGRRTEPEHNSWTNLGGGFANLFGFNDFGQAPGFHIGNQGAGGNGEFGVSVLFGAFPFGIFSWFSSNQPNPLNRDATTGATNDSEWMSKVFLAIAVFFLVLLFLA